MDDAQLQKVLAAMGVDEERLRGLLGGHALPKGEGPPEKPDPQWVEDYLTYLRKIRRPDTVNAVERALVAWVTFLDDHGSNLVGAGADEVVDYLDTLRSGEGNYGRHKRPHVHTGERHPNTVDRLGSHVPRFYKWAHARGLPRREIASIEEAVQDWKMANLGTVPEAERHVFTLEEAQRLFGIIRRPDHRALYALGFKTGARINELLGLQLDGVDLQEGTLTLPITGKRKAHTNRLIPLDDEGKGYLSEWLEAREWDDRYTESPLVWTSREHRHRRDHDPETPYSAGEANRVFQRYARLAGIRATPGTHIVGHSMRHTFTSLMSQRGCSDPVVQWMRGDTTHATIDRYRKITASRRNNWEWARRVYLEHVFPLA